MLHEVMKKGNSFNVSETNIIRIFLNKSASGKTKQDINRYGKCNENMVGATPYMCDREKICTHCCLMNYRIHV